MKSIFDPDGFLWKPFGYLGDFIMLSLMWVVCCIPVITIGPSTAALYDAAVHAVKRKDDSLFRRFVSTFKRELFTGMTATLIWLLVIGAVYSIYRFLLLPIPQGHARSVILIFYLVLVTFFLLCIFSWVFPTLSRFTFTAGALCITSARIAFGNILRSAAMALMIAGTAFLSFRFAIPLMVLPGMCAFFSTFLIEPVFKKYQDDKAK